MFDISHQGHVTILRMVHGKANTLSLEFCATLSQHIATFRASPAHALVITGSGQIFSAGVDLLRLSDGGAPYVREFLPVLNAMFAAVFSCPKPIIAAINGHAIAGGCVLACAADRRLMAREQGRIGVTELLVGVPFPPMAFEVMRFATPPAFFPEVIFSGATHPPDVAQARRLVDELAEPDALLDRAVAAAETFAALPPATFAMTKRQIRQDAIDRMAQHGARLDADAEKIWAAPDTLAHIRDYVSRTFKKG